MFESHLRKENFPKKEVFTNEAGFLVQEDRLSLSDLKLIAETLSQKGRADKEFFFFLPAKHLL
ncbi:MAG: hypothetical protein AAB443_01425 [Patescibacteria group bacterium]